MSKHNEPIDNVCFENTKTYVDCVMKEVGRLFYNLYVIIGVDVEYIFQGRIKNILADKRKLLENYYSSYKFKEVFAKSSYDESIKRKEISVQMKLKYEKEAKRVDELQKEIKDLKESNTSLLKDLKKLHEEAIENALEFENKYLEEEKISIKYKERFELLNAESVVLLEDMKDTLYVLLKLFLDELGDKIYNKVGLMKTMKRIKNRDPELYLIMDINKDIKVKKDMIFAKSEIANEDILVAYKKTPRGKSRFMKSIKNSFKNMFRPVARNAVFAQSRLIPNNNSPAWTHRIKQRSISKPKNMNKTKSNRPKGTKI